MDYYNKIDKSVLYYGITILKKIIDSFTCRTHLKPGKSRDLRLIWKAKKKVLVGVLPSGKYSYNLDKQILGR